jgi:hypothetical protein
MDVDICHSTADPGSRMRAGAWNHDDCGIVHWGLYEVGFSTTSNYGVHLAYMHYLTGDERALDVAREITNALKWFASNHGLGPFEHRGSGMSLWNIIELWQLTGDPELKKIADHYAREHVKAVRNGLASGYYPENPADFTLSYVMPAMIRYHMLTGDKAVGEWIVNQAAHLAEVQRPGSGSGFMHLDALAYGHQLTGDPRYLDAGRIWLESLLFRMNRDGEAEYFRVTPFIGQRVWWMYQAPMLMAGLKTVRQPPPDAIQGNDLATTGDLIILNERAKPLQVNVVVSLPRENQAAIEKAVQAGDLAVVLRNPTGEIVTRAQYPGGNTFDRWFFYGGWIAKLADAKRPMRGVYRVELQTSIPEAKLLLKPVACTSPKLMSRVVPDGESNGGYRYFIFVPRGTRQVGFKVEADGRGWTWGPVNQARLFDSRGKEVATLDFRAKDNEAGRKKATEWIALTAPVPPEDRGAVWQIEPPPYVSARKIELISAPPYLAPTAESCFDPNWKP